MAPRIVLLIFMALFLLVTFLSNPDVSRAAMIERVVAIVNSDIILESELEEAKKRAASESGGVDERAVLDRLISRMLILQEARRTQPGMDSYMEGSAREDELVDDYIQKRIVSLIHVPFRKIEEYYEEHRDEFGDRDVYSVWAEIEEILRKKRAASAIAEHVRKLRKESYIRIQIDAANYR
jgi:hypothetical protein